MWTVVVTRHGEQRCRERLGIPRRAVLRTVRRVWERGAAVDIDRDEHVKRQVSRCQMRIYGGHCFLFSVRDGVPALVTVLEARCKDEDRAGLIAEADYYRFLSGRR